MNKGYLYDAGKLYVGGDHGIKVMDYTDNIDKILELEDIIELLEEQQQNYQDRLKNYRSMGLLYILINILIRASIICACWLIVSFTSNLDLFICFIINTVSVIEVGSILLKIKKIIKNKHGIVKAFDYVNHELNNKKEELEKIKNIKSKNKEAEFKNNLGKKYEVDNTKELYCTDDIIDLYYEVGISPKKYRKYLKNGKMKDIIVDIYKDIYNEKINQDQVNNTLLKISEVIKIKKKKSIHK